MRLRLGTAATAVAALCLPLLSLVLAPPAADAGTPRSWSPSWQETVLDEGQSFRGLDAVDRRTAWVAGESRTEGGDPSIWRTTDGGATWDEVGPTGVTGLMFRDIDARSASTASVLAIGYGGDSRIYRTTDGGQTWTETFRNDDPDAFYNCLDFYPGGRRGLAVSDAVGDAFRIIATDDFGRSWHELPTAGMPDSTGEYNFSASGDCLVIRGQQAYFGSGGAQARVFHSADRGRTWTAVDSGIAASEGGGVFGLAFRTPFRGVAVGGDFAAPDDGTDAASYTRHARTWVGGGDLTTLGEDAAYVSGRPHTLVAVGEYGDAGASHVSTDGGRTWTAFGAGFHTVDCTPDGSCWAAGSAGRVGRLVR
jgi:photosystem II stability/assembly factor-like uncharacterized protein